MHNAMICMRLESCRRFAYTVWFREARKPVSRARQLSALFTAERPAQLLSRLHDIQQRWNSAGRFHRCEVQGYFAGLSRWRWSPVGSRPFVDIVQFHHSSAFATVLFRRYRYSHFDILRIFMKRDTINHLCKPTNGWAMLRPYTCYVLGSPISIRAPSHSI